MEKAIKKRGLKRPAVASLWYVGAGSLTKAIGVLTTPIFTRVLSEGDYGTFSLYMSWLGIGSILCSAFTQGSVIYTGLEKFRGNNDEFISSAMWVSFGFCCVICLLLFTFIRFLGLNYQLIVLMSFQLLCDCAISVNMSSKRHRYHYITVVAISVIQAFSAPILGIALIVGGGIGYMGRIYGILLPSLVIALPIAVITLFRSRRAYNGEMCSYIVRRSAPILPQALSSALSAQADKLIITAVMGTAALAKYSVAHALGAGLTMTVSALSSALNPWMIRKIKNGDGESVHALVSRGLMMLSAAVLFLIGSAPEAMLILAPEGYADALPSVAPIAIATIPAFVSSVCTVAVISKERSGGTAIAAILSSAVSAVSALLLIPTLGFVGAGMAMLLSQMAAALINVYILSRTGLSTILPWKSFAASMAIALVLAPVLGAAKDNFLLRLVLLSIPTVTLLYNGYFIKEMVLEKK